MFYQNLWKDYILKPLDSQNPKATLYGHRYAWVPSYDYDKAGFGAGAGASAVGRGGSYRSMGVVTINNIVTPP